MVGPGIVVWFHHTGFRDDILHPACLCPVNHEAASLHEACFCALFASEQHPYMKLVSVLCLPVSSIPTSLSFFKSFCPCVIR